MSDLATVRYHQIRVGPDEVAPAQELLNTAPSGHEGDLLADVASARAWLRACIQDYMPEAAKSAPSLARLTEKDLSELRNLRTSLYDAVTSSASQDDLFQVEGEARFVMQNDGAVAIQPLGRFSEWFRITLLVLALRAQVSGTWPRLKVCANPTCEVAFYDRSRNSSGVWHDVHACGNAINLRASRARRASVGKPRRASSASA